MSKLNIDNRFIAILFAALLFASAILVFPYYMQPEPSPSAALLFSLIPISVLFYCVCLALFVW